MSPITSAPAGTGDGDEPEEEVGVVDPEELVEDPADEDEDDDAAEELDVFDDGSWLVVVLADLVKAFVPPQPVITKAETISTEPA